MGKYLEIPGKYRNKNCEIIWKVHEKFQKSTEKDQKSTRGTAEVQGVKRVPGVKVPCWSNGKSDDVEALFGVASLAYGQLPEPACCQTKG